MGGERSIHPSLLPSYCNCSFLSSSYLHLFVLLLLLSCWGFVVACACRSHKHCRDDNNKTHDQTQQTQDKFFADSKQMHIVFLMSPTQTTVAATGTQTTNNQPTNQTTLSNYDRNRTLESLSCLFFLLLSGSSSPTTPCEFCVCFSIVSFPPMLPLLMW